MKLFVAGLVVAFLSLALSLTPLTVAQTSAQTVSALPRLVRFGGTVKDLNGDPLTGVVGVTFAFYSEKIGGAPLWLETQNATADSSGHYTVLLGSTKPEGLPAELFTSEQARWVGVQVSGQPEQPRALLVSAPYALKAGDAETIGGLPPSAFVLAAPPIIGSLTSSSTAATVPPPAATDVTTTGGTLNYLPIFSGAATIVDSAVFQTGTSPTAKIGIDTITPATQLDVNGAGTIRGTLTLPATGAATATGGKNSQGLNLVASAFSSTSKTALNQTFRWQAEAAANDTAAPSGTLNLQYGLGTAAPAETGLRLSNKGIFTFATGQTFPGTGDGSVTSVATGLGLKGGPITKTGTLTIDTTKIPQLSANNTFTGNNAISVNNLTAALTLTNSDLAGGDALHVFGNGGAVGIYESGAAFGITASGSSVGVQGSSSSSSGSGVQGTGGTGVVGESTLGGGPGGSFTGFTAPSGSGSTGTNGVDSTGGNGDPSGETSGGTGVMGSGGSSAGFGGAGGVFSGGSGFVAASGDGIDATTDSSAYAGNFTGDINVTGQIFAGTKDFKIDHPLDPADKYLVHASVESSEMMNIYTGNVITDAQGHAIVQMPQWFEVLNTDFRYQLTVIGQFAQAIVAHEIENNRFEIRTNAPNVKVSWQVTGVRQDAYAKAHPLVVEQEKEARLRGFYIHPELYGAPAEKQIEWARHPQMMKRIQEMKARQLATIKAAAQPLTAQSK